MKAYSFPMEKVLEWRTHSEKSTMEKFAVLQNELQHHKLVLLELTNRYESTKERSLKYKTIQELLQQQLYKQKLEEKISLQNKAINSTSANLEKVRVELIAAQKDRKIMEKLKEKDFSTYNDEVKDEEQRELDEIAVLKFKKKTF
ncbi:flagellar export protein FliJ [Alkalibaculum sp. M08DMB]|uniref:Flagellar FliJ protein n=1 Tax=Alkalibaculum sporogenes TaxID=2655001 RepID=A0A6A7K5Z0_9FIRM|nr:flagellar export protein FliJ [Alkalibaculum sporogenes]MPW24795.1 flagellar export protein FliJ [Alkalibaculum sporogenes]